METLKRFGRFCGTICSAIFSFIISAATLATTNALSPAAFKEKMMSSANGLVDVATNQMVVNGVPAQYASMIKAHLGVDQLVAMIYMTIIGIVMGLLWFVLGSIWSHIFPKRVLPIGPSVGKEGQAVAAAPVSSAAPVQAAAMESAIVQPA